MPSALVSPLSVGWRGTAAEVAICQDLSFAPCLAGKHASQEVLTVIHHTLVVSIQKLGLSWKT